MTGSTRPPPCRHPTAGAAAMEPVDHDGKHAHELAEVRADLLVAAMEPVDHDGKHPWGCHSCHQPR